VQFARTDPRKYSFAVRSIEGWNKLPVNCEVSNQQRVLQKKAKKTQGLTQNEQSEISDDDREWKI
jgi:hypothetical protein